MGSNDDLKTLAALLETTIEGEGLASEIEKPARLKELILELKNKASKERKQLSRDQIGTRYDLCMIGILEELNFGRLPWHNVLGLDLRFARIRSEIERTILEINHKRRIM